MDCGYRIRWGIDRESRKALGLPEYHENTWVAGLERMLLGYALPSREDELFGGILPFDRIEGGEATVLGQFLKLTDRLFSLEKQGGEPRSLEGWGDFLTRMLDDFFLSDEDSEPDLLFIRRALCRLGEQQRLSACHEKIALEVIKSHLGAILEKEGFGAGFLTGGVTFCALLPMRSIPFKVIGLLGMNDEAYPRPTRYLGFDLMAKNPQSGDRSLRNDDRYLFLEVLLSAREILHLSFVGQSIQDNTRRPPSVLVSELLDYLEAGYRIPQKELRRHLLRRHPLQAFSPAYFKKDRDDRFFSFSRENLEAARKAQNPHPEGTPFIRQDLPDPPRTGGRLKSSSSSGFSGTRLNLSSTGGWGSILRKPKAFWRKPNLSRSRGWKNMIWNKGWWKKDLESVR